MQPNVQPNKTPAGSGSRDKAIEKVRELMKDIKFCMFTTQDQHGAFRSRPMTLQESEFDGDLWFFTGKSTHLVGEVQHDSRVNVSFANSGGTDFVSVYGHAHLSTDRAKIEQLWNPLYKAWFPKGMDDPDLTLLKIEGERAEYWDTPNGAATLLWGAMKAALKGEQQKFGEHDAVRL